MFTQHLHNTFGVGIIERDPRGLEPQSAIYDDVSEVNDNLYRKAYTNRSYHKMSTYLASHDIKAAQTETSTLREEMAKHRRESDAERLGNYSEINYQLFSTNVIAAGRRKKNLGTLKT